MKKMKHHVRATILVTLSIVVFLLWLPSMTIAHAEDNCKGINPGTLIYWNSEEMKIGQIGQLTIIKDTPLYKLDGANKLTKRLLKAGESYRIYGFQPGKLSVGGGLYVDRDARVSYRTPSQAKLLQLRCKKDAMESSKTSISMNESKQSVEAKFGQAKRISGNEYKMNWYTYHNGYKKFYMVGYVNDRVSTLFTNDRAYYLGSVHVGSTREEVQAGLGSVVDGILKGSINFIVSNDTEQQTFLKNGVYITVFYDLYHQNQVTAIQEITADVENRKSSAYAIPSSTMQQDFEMQMFDLLNADRVKNGVPALAWGEKARTSARKHSLDMATQQYFAHVNFKGETPFDRMKSAGINYRTAGENIAFGYPSSIFAHEGLMNSLGHRENILNKNYKYAGIGVAFQKNTNKPYYTQNFYTPF